MSVVGPTCPQGWTYNKQQCKCVKDGTPPPPPPVVSNNYKFSSKFGSEGNGDGQFIDPHDTTFDSEDNIYIPDRERNDIQVFTHDGKFIRKFGGPGSGEGQFNVPYSCQIGPGDTVWVCDRENSRVQKLNKDGTFVQQWTEMNGKKLNMPEDLAFDNSKQFLYFTDTENNRIVKCTANMEFVLEWGSKGTGDSQFDHPHGIDVGPDGNVYVNSGFQPYIKKFTPDGQFIKKWGSEGTGPGQFLMFLEHLDVDEHGRVFIINNNIRPYVFIFDSEGTYLGKFGSEKEGGNDGEFKEPEHVTIDKQGRAFCVDSGNFRIQVFAPEGNIPPPPPPPPPITCPPGQHLENGICVPDTTPPPPPPPPPTGDVLWDSNIHLKTGQAFTVTDTYGDQKPDGKGVFMAASGSPRLIVDADGTFHLEADSGHGRVYIKAINFNAMIEGEIMFEDEAIRNSTWRLRSRHNEGGDCANRFGGFGATCERAEQLAEYQTEECHNVHDNAIKKPLAKPMEVGKWLKFKFSVKNSADNKTVDFKTEYDYNDGAGFVEVLSGNHPSPPPQGMDEATLMKESYAWLRVNNESTGKVAFKNVRIIKI